MSQLNILEVKAERCSRETRTKKLVHSKAMK
jgi:hypothetical protein